jgi:hypothetical protein
MPAGYTRHSLKPQFRPEGLLYNIQYTIKLFIIIELYFLFQLIRQLYFFLHSSEKLSLCLEMLRVRIKPATAVPMSMKKGR